MTLANNCDDAAFVIEKWIPGDSNMFKELIQIDTNINCRMNWIMSVDKIFHLIDIQ